MTETNNPEQQQAYANGYHVGYQHGLEAARAAANGQPGSVADYPINVTARYSPESSRLLMFFWFVRGFLLIPHLIVLWFLGFAAFWVAIFAWFAVVFTGSYPRALWDYQVGFMRWTTRINAYFLCLTDEYPPFTLN
jgi:hypothetical protein